MIIRMIGKISRRLIILLAICLFLPGHNGEAAPPPAADSYTLRLFSDDTVLRNPNSGVTGYFEIYPDSSVTEPAVLDLWYSYSPTVRTEFSTITVSLNGIPVVSRLLEAQQASAVNWQVALPASQIKTGVNSVEVAVVHRTIDGLCRDIDNEANWVIIRPQTSINFKVNRSPYSLSSYPRPFLDEYLASKINTVFYLPVDYDPFMLASLLNLATEWGGRGLAGAPQCLEVRLGEPGQVPANEVVLGLTGKWLANRNLPAGASVLKLDSLPGGYSRLLLAGDNNNSIGRAVEALNRPQLVKTFFGQEVVLTSALPPEPPKAARALPGKKGLYTLLDLGYQDDIPVAGAFHQDSVINVPRPPNYKIGDGSYIELHFRHSRVLDPKKSAVTIYVNNIPVRAVALTAENAERGVLKAPIPPSELDKAHWRVRFGFYHDLGIIDCSKRYDEVAWSVVEKETAVHLEPGNIGRMALLQDFPNNFSVGAGGVVNLTMLLPEKPSAEELSAALKLAYYIGQQNQSKISWQVQTITSFDEKQAPGAVIALGRNNDAGQWGALKKYLSVYPEAGGGYHVDSWLEALPGLLGGFDICQVAGINDEKLVYAFMYTSPARLNNLLNYFLVKGNSLTGQVTMIDDKGTRISFARQSSTPAGFFAWLKSAWAQADSVAGIYLIIFILALAGTLLLMRFIRKRP